MALISNAVTKGIDPTVKLKDSGIEWLGQIPEHWEVKKLKYVAVLSNLKIEHNEENPLPYIGLENVIPWKGKVKLNEEDYIPEGISNCFKKGAILFSKLRPYLAKAFIADFEGICSSELLVMETIKSMNSRFLLHCFLSDGFIKMVSSSTYGSKMPRASWDYIGNLKIPILSKEEQNFIVDYLKTESSRIDSLQTKTNSTINKLQEYKTAIISAAVTGKIKVSE